MLARNSALDDETRRASDEKIYKGFTSLPEYKSAGRVFAYISVGNEVSTDAITDKLLADGKEVYVPLCHGKGEMDARRISSKSDLKPGRYGIPEPEEDAEKTEPCDIDLIIVPGAAFGEDGSRLGRGGGYYDRFLKCAANAKKIALAREINIEKAVPQESHDESVDIIVTDLRTIKIR